VLVPLTLPLPTRVFLCRRRVKQPASKLWAAWVY